VIILTDFDLKEKDESLQLVGDKFFEIAFLIDWKIFRIIVESIFFNKAV